MQTNDSSENYGADAGVCSQVGRYLCLFYPMSASICNSDSARKVTISDFQ